MSCSGQSDKEWSLRKKVLPLRYFHLLGELLVRRMPFCTLTLTTVFIPNWKDALTSECTGLTCPRAPSGRLLSVEDLFAASSLCCCFASSSTEPWITEEAYRTQGWKSCTGEQTLWSFVDSPDPHPFFLHWFLSGCLRYPMKQSTPNVNWDHWVL